MAGVDKRAKYLFEIKGVSFGTLQDLGANRLGQILDLEEVTEQLL
jgi:hypothetical protein